MGLMLFMTFPFVIFLVIVDLLTLLISGMISVYAIARLSKDGVPCSKSLLIVAMICQVFFCADIISLVVVVITVKNNRQNMKKQSEAFNF